MDIELIGKDLEIKELVTVVTVEDAVRLYPKLKGIRFNHVVSKESSSATISSEISNELDRLVLRAIRSTSDLILTTGKTAIAEELKASNYAPLLIVTTQPEIAIPATTVPSKEVVLITNDQGPLGNPNCRSIGHIHGSLSEYVKSLRADYESIALESGLSTASELSKAGLIDEICLTVTNCIDAQDATAILNNFLKHLAAAGQVIQTLHHDSTWLFRVSCSKTSQ